MNKNKGWTVRGMPLTVLRRKDMVKLIVCDVDGTLLEKGSEKLNEKTVEALEKLYKAGKKIAFASGRTYFGIRKIAQELSFAQDIYYICCDGAVCIYREKVLYHKQISIENILKISRSPLYEKSSVVYYSDTFSYVMGSTPEFLAGLEAQSIDCLDPVSGMYDVKAPIYKIGIYNNDTRPERLNPCPFELRVCYESCNWLEYTSRFANKGLALSDLQMRLYLTKLETAALGDGENDIEMFSKAKYTYASVNGCEKLKEICDEQFFFVNEALEKLLYK